MANYTKATLARIGRLMGSGEPAEPSALVKLAKAGAFGRKAIYNWSLPETDPQHRKMPRIAKRMIAMLAYFSAAGLLTDKRLEEIMALETTFENETETAAVLRRMNRAISGKPVKTGGKPKAAEAVSGAPPGEAEDWEMDDDTDQDDVEHAGATPRAA